MASFQVPQFLDSGDKIIAGLGFRQFGWALGGGLLSFLVFSLLTPILGNFSLVFVAPMVGVFAFIAFGTYNGRSAETYLLKFVAFFFQKTKQMKYQRQPYVEDLNKKASEWTEKAILARWQAELDKKKALAENDFLDFRTQSPEEKAQTINKLSRIMNQSKTNVMAQILKQEEELRKKQNSLQDLNQK